jgi:hypothetical protein
MNQLKTKKQKYHSSRLVKAAELVVFSGLSASEVKVGIKIKKGVGTFFAQNLCISSALIK